MDFGSIELTGVAQECGITFSLDRLYDIGHTALLRLGIGQGAINDLLNAVFCLGRRVG